MKKLEKLVLRELEEQTPLKNRIDPKTVIGGGIDDNDCLFEAMTVIGDWLQCNNYSYDQWCSEYVNTFGLEAFNDALSNGVPQERAIDFLDNYFAVSDAATIGSGTGTQLGFLVTGDSAHAVLIMGEMIIGSDTYITYYDPESGALNYAPPSQFAGTYNVDCN